MQPDKAASVLSQFPDHLQVEIAERIGTISSTSPLVIERIEKVIENKFSNYIENDTENVGGVHTLVEILNSVSRSTEKNILNDLEKRQPELSNEVKSSLFTFEDIVTLERLDVQKVLRDVQNDVLVLALKGTTDDIKNFYFLQPLITGGGKSTRRNSIYGSYPLVCCRRSPTKCGGCNSTAR